MTTSVASNLGPQISQMLRHTAGVVGLRVIAAPLGLLGGILLARYLGAYNLGILAYAGAWTGVLSVIATLGFNQLLVREVAIHHNRQDWARLKGVVQFTMRTGLLASIGLAVAGSVVALWLTDSGTDTDLLWTFLISASALPLGTLIQLRQSTMRGLKRVTLGLLPEMAIRPALSIVFVTAGYFLLGRTLSAPQAVAISLVSVVVTFLIGNHILRSSLPHQLQGVKPYIAGRQWITMAGPLFLITIIQFLNTQIDVLMLGYLAPTEEVGFYAVAKSLADLVIFVLVAAEMILAPSIAHMYANGQKGELQYIVNRAALTVNAIGIPAALALILWGDLALRLYGSGFTPAFAALQILCLGQLVNVLCGPIGQLAIHTGHDKATTCVVAIAAMVNIMFNWLLIPQYGAIGAAAATSLSLAVWNVGLLVYIQAKTGLSSLAVPLPSKIMPKRWMKTPT